jgi:hypothetical protein
MCYEVKGRGEVNNPSRIFLHGFEKRHVWAEKRSQINPVSIWEEEKILHFQHHTQYVALFNNTHGIKWVARFP